MEAQYPAGPPTVEEIVAVMRSIGDSAEGRRLRASVVLLWRAWSADQRSAVTTRGTRFCFGIASGVPAIEVARCAGARVGGEFHAKELSDLAARVHQAELRRTFESPDASSVMCECSGPILRAMLPAEAPEIVRQTLGSSDAVVALTLGGSRARGTATELSDWDLYLDGEPARLMAEIPGLMAPLRPLGAFWEPLSEDAGYMMVMDGPVKIDLFPRGCRRSLQPPWEPASATLSGIDGHYWDWMLWLGSKALRHQDELISDELAKMQWFLLGPLGVEGTPVDLRDAVALYLKARAVTSERLRTSVPEGLGQQVLTALRQQRLV